MNSFLHQAVPINTENPLSSNSDHILAQLNSAMAFIPCKNTPFLILSYKLTMFASAANRPDSHQGRMCSIKDFSDACGWLAVVSHSLKWCGVSSAAHLIGQRNGLDRSGTYGNRRMNRYLSACAQRCGKGSIDRSHGSAEVQKTRNVDR